MIIYNPLLPPLAGYVEVEINGERKYKNAKTGILKENEIPEPDYKTLYEEMLEINAAQDDALIELYEMIGGASE